MRWKPFKRFPLLLRLPITRLKPGVNELAMFLFTAALLFAFAAVRDAQPGVYLVAASRKSD